MRLAVAAFAAVVLAGGQARASGLAVKAGAEAGVTVNVATTGTDGPTCGSSGSPCATLAGAVAAIEAQALNGWQPVTVSFADGWYANTAAVLTPTDSGSRAYHLQVVA